MHAPRDIEELAGRLGLPPHGFHLRETAATSAVALAMTLNFFAWPKTGYLMEDIWHTDRRKISA